MPYSDLDQGQHGFSLLFDGTKPLPDRILTSHWFCDINLIAISLRVPELLLYSVESLRIIENFWNYCHVSQGPKSLVLRIDILPWWRHQMETFSVLLALCAGNSPVAGEFPSQRPETRNFDVFFDLHLNKRLSKQSRRRLVKTPWRSLWRHCSLWVNQCKDAVLRAW